MQIGGRAPAGHRLLQNQLVITAQLHPPALAGNPRHQFLRTGEFIVAERHRQAFWPGIHPFDVGAAARLLELDDCKEVAHRIRHRPEPLDKFGDKAVSLGRHVKIGYAPIKRQPYRQIGNIVFGDTHLQPQIELRCPVDDLFGSIAIAGTRRLNCLRSIS